MIGGEMKNKNKLTPAVIRH